MPGSGYSTEQIGKRMGTSVYDVFIAHASEDKDTFVRPLAVALDALGVTVWYDEFSLRPGDSISRSIDKGIAGARHGLVVISRTFIEKPWPEYELRGLVTREIGGEAKIVPIWHGVDKEEVASFSPPIADKLAIRTDKSTATDVALQVVATVRPDIYRSHPRGELAKLASGDAVRALQAELDSVRESLAQFQCPHCGSLQVEHGIHAFHEDEVEITIYECGHHEQNGTPVRMCPRDPRFPGLDEYNLEYYEHTRDLWECAARPKTTHAHQHRFGPVKGRTKDEATKFITEEYRRSAGHEPDRSILIMH